MNRTPRHSQDDQAVKLHTDSSMPVSRIVPQFEVTQGVAANGHGHVGIVSLACLFWKPQHVFLFPPKCILAAQGVRFLL